VVQVPLQTTVAVRGDLTVSAAGTGVLQPATEVQLGFGTSGKLTALDIKAGDQVKKGQLLAELDNTAAQVKYEQAQRTLANLTSPTSIAQAEQDVATAQTAQTNAQYALMHVISPGVFYARQQLEADQQALAAVQAAAGTPPTADEQKAIADAEAKVQQDQAVLAGNMDWYKQVYVPQNFTVMGVNPTSANPNHRRTQIVEAPSDLEIQTAQAAYSVAKTSVLEAQWYLDALNGKEVPDNASGANLQALRSAQFAAQSAQATLAGSQIYAPLNGTVLSISATVGDNVSSSPMIVLGDLTGLYLKTYVKEKDYQKFQVGSEADIVFEALPGETFKGKVIQVDPGLDTSTNTPVVSGLVQMDPTSDRLLMGMNASVDIIVGRAQKAVLVPVAALHEYAPGKYAVFVMRNGKLSVDFVQVGLQDQTNAEVTSGLNPGDVVSTGLVGTKQP
jgi:RND family efflux transporter MFP subunit